MLTIEHPLTGEKILVAKNDFEHQMTWEDANRECNNIGPGWRLPTIEEFKVIYQELHLKGEGNFKEEFYWTSKKRIPFGICIGEADVVCSNHTSTEYVRAVKSMYE